MARSGGRPLAPHPDAGSVLSQAKTRPDARPPPLPNLQEAQAAEHRQSWAVPSGASAVRDQVSRASPSPGQGAEDPTLSWPRPGSQAHVLLRPRAERCPARGTWQHTTRPTGQAAACPCPRTQWLCGRPPAASSSAQSCRTRSPEPLWVPSGHPQGPAPTSLVGRGQDALPSRAAST